MPRIFRLSALICATTALALAALLSTAPVSLAAADPLVAPDPPTNFTAATQDGVVTFGFDPPAANWDGWGTRIERTPEGASNWTFFAFIGNPSVPTDDGLYDYRARSTNRDGQMSSWTLESPSVPFPPTGVTATAGAANATAASIEVSWTPPARVPRPPTSYDVRWAPVGADEWSEPVSVPSTDATIGSLATDTQYEVEVRSVRDGLSSAWQGEGVVVTNGPPGPISGARLTPSADDIRIDWDAYGDPITDYDVRYRAEGGAWSTATVSSDGSIYNAGSFTATGLAHHVVYEFQIRATNDFGTGAWSTTSTSQLLDLPPRIDDIRTFTEGTHISLEWTAADCDCAGIGIDEYQVRIRVAGDSTWATADVASEHYEWLNLIIGQTYEMEVRAHNQDGYGEWSESRSATIPYPPLGPPRNVVLTPGDGSLSVSWRPPSEVDTQPILDYEVTAAPESAPNAALTQITTSPRASFRGLVNATAYVVTVRARSATSIGATTTTDPTYVYTFSPKVAAVNGSPVASVRSGDRLVISGHGALPGADVSAELHSTPVQLGSTMVSSFGDFAFTVVIPAGTAAGEHEIVTTLVSGGDEIARTTTPLIVLALVPAGTSSTAAGAKLAPTGTDRQALFVGALGALIAIALGTVLMGRSRTRRER